MISRTRRRTYFFYKSNDLTINNERVATVFTYGPHSGTRLPTEISERSSTTNGRVLPTTTTTAQHTGPIEIMLERHIKIDIM